MEETVKNNVRIEGDILIIESVLNGITRIKVEKFEELIGVNIVASLGSVCLSLATLASYVASMHEHMDEAMVRDFTSMFPDNGDMYAVKLLMDALKGLDY